MLAVATKELLELMRTGEPISEARLEAFCDEEINSIEFEHVYPDKVRVKGFSMLNGTVSKRMYVVS